MIQFLEMGKDMKIKHIVSCPLTKHWGTFFVKKLCMEEQTFLGKFMGECFTGGRGRVNTPKRGLNLKNTCTLFLWGWGFHVKPVFFFKKVLVVTSSLMSWGCFRFTYGSNSWRSELRHHIKNWKDLASNPGSR